jgi:rhodanese-related sulfurtransferase
VPSSKSEIRSILAEALIVVVVGLGVGLAANALSPRGLALSRDYFPRGTNRGPSPAPVAPRPAQPAPAPAATNESPEAAQISERLRAKDLQEIKRDQVELLLRDPRRLDGRVVFVDARNPEDYDQGHVPGAYQLDPYHPEKELATVVPVCQAAQEVVVYCNGGDCEDSDSAAILLRDAGVPGEKLFVYGGGFTAWQAARLPVETGARNSGTESK